MEKTPPKWARAPLTTEELESLRADDLLRIRLTEDEKRRLRAINQERSHQRGEEAKLRRVEEEPILEDLRAIGIELSSIWDLVNKANPYPEAIPILLKHLGRDYSDRTKEGIARALAVPYATDAWPILAAEYRRVSKGSDEGIKLGAASGLAAALAATATDEVIDQLAAFAKDPSNGSSRLLLLSAFRKSNTVAARQVLEDLASDPTLQQEIKSWRKTRRS